MDGLPCKIEPVFIWHTEPTWLIPSHQQERMTVISSTCSAMFGYQSETHSPLCPYCLKVRFDAITPFIAVPIAVVLGRMDSGRGCPSSSTSFGFGSKRSMWLGPPSMKSQITDFADGLW